MKAWSSALLAKVPSLIHGFGTREEPIPASLRAVWEERKPVWKQVHGAAVCEVQGNGHVCGDVDAVWTQKAQSPIAVVTADCVPILLARKDGKACAAVHAGWRGTRAHILRALWKELSAKGDSPGNWFAAVGPAVGPCCYDVNEELAADFAREFAALGNDLAVPRGRFLDLPAINAEVLRQIGVAEVDLIRACTRCTKDASQSEVFHSYRREGGGTRQYSMLMLKDNL